MYPSMLPLFLSAQAGAYIHFVTIRRLPPVAIAALCVLSQVVHQLIYGVVRAFILASGLPARASVAFIVLILRCPCLFRAIASFASTSGAEMRPVVVGLYGIKTAVHHHPLRNIREDSLRPVCLPAAASAPDLRSWMQGIQCYQL